MVILDSPGIDSVSFKGASKMDDHRSTRGHVTKIRHVVVVVSVAQQQTTSSRRFSPTQRVGGEARNCSINSTALDVRPTLDLVRL